MAGWDKLVSAVLLAALADSAGTAARQAETPVLLGIERASGKAHEHGPIALTNPVSVFRIDDYPVAAIRAGEQGRVVVMLVVGAAGQVVSCAVTESSGSMTLDSTTCSIALNRLTYQPATDRRGRTIAGETSFAVRWELPSGAVSGSKLLEPNTTSVEIVVDAHGRNQSCAIVVNGKNVDLPPTGSPCDDPARAIADVLPMMARPQQKPYPFLLVQQMRQSYGGTPDQAPPIEPDLTILRRIEIRFAVHADGTASDCRVTATPPVQREVPSPICTGRPMFIMRPVGSEQPQPPGRELQGVWTMITAIRPLPTKPGI